MRGNTNNSLSVSLPLLLRGKTENPSDEVEEERGRYYPMRAHEFQILILFPGSPFQSDETP